MENSVRTPWHLWVVGALATVWNGFGALNYTMTQIQHPTWMALMTGEQKAFLEAAPSWLHGTWAIGVWGGLIGALLLLTGSRYAVAACHLAAGNHR